MSKISRHVSHSVTLGTAGYGSPLTITTEGMIEPTAAGANGVVVPSGYAGAAIVNHGYISGGYGGTAYNPGGAAIYCASDLSLKNLNTISGGTGGPGPSGQAALGGNGVDVSGAAIVTNAGQILGGTGGTGFYGGYGGIGINIDGSIRLTNAGTINGGTGGNANGGNYCGGGGTGVNIDGSMILTNTGTITGGTGGDAYYLAGGGGTGIDISGIGTIINRGEIVGGAPGSGLLIPGQGAGLVMVSGGTVINSGSISGAVTVGADSRVVNSGRIVVESRGPDGLHAGSNSTVVNAGVIEGGTRFAENSGVNIASGTLTNKNGATIEGGTGVVFQSDGTLINAGNIYEAHSVYAVRFYGSQSTLIMDPTAKFNGKVAAPGGAGDVLELAGKTAGTLQFLGSRYIGFGTVEVSHGANWTLAKTSTIASGTTLLDSGNLQVSNSLSAAGRIVVEKHGTLEPTGTGKILSNNLTLAGGTISASAQSLFVIGTTTIGAAAGSITIDSGATLAGNGFIVDAPLVDNGTLIAQQVLHLQSDVSGSGVLTISADASVYARYALGVASIDFTTGGQEVLLATAGAVTGTISGFSSGDTIDIRPIIATTLSFLSGTLTLLDGTTPVDRLSLDGSYDIANFSLESDGHGGVDIGYVPNGDRVASGNFATHEFSPTIDFFSNIAHW